MRVLLTGASSFTGYWFAATLSQAGHHVVMPLRGAQGTYVSQPRANRVRLLQELGEVVWSCPFGSDRFLDLVRREPVDILCHHAAQVKDYRSDSFDVLAALENNTHRVSELMSSAANIGAIVLTGTVFEFDEGIGDEPMRAFSPYGLSKGLTFQVFRYWCLKRGIPFGKFVIPNPFGPYEEARFVSYLLNCFLRRQVATVGTPSYIRDNIHVDLLAKCYAAFCDTVGKSARSITKCNPSGYVESQAAFAFRVSREMRKRLGLPCDVVAAVQTDFPEPLIRSNDQMASRMVPAWCEDHAWDQLVQYYDERNVASGHGANGLPNAALGDPGCRPGQSGFPS
ncbi:MAG: NAD-dependent epimerase/dehydratase family protein [Pseudomonadota bacterium]